MAAVRCFDCGAEFNAVTPREDLCPPCTKAEDKRFAPETVEAVPFQPWKFSTAAMRERLGTLTGKDE